MKSRIKVINELKKKTNNAPDVTYKDFPVKNKIITLIYSNSVSSSISINDFILRRLDENIDEINDKDLYNYFKNYIPNNSMVEINTVNDNLAAGNIVFLSFFLLFLLLRQLFLTK